MHLRTDQVKDLREFILKLMITHHMDISSLQVEEIIEQTIDDLDFIGELEQRVIEYENALKEGDELDGHA